MIVRQNASQGADFHGVALVSRRLDPTVGIAFGWFGVGLALRRVEAGWLVEPTVSDVLTDSVGLKRLPCTVDHHARPEEPLVVAVHGEDAVAEEISAARADLQILGEGLGDLQQVWQISIPHETHHTLESRSVAQHSVDGRPLGAATRHESRRVG